MTMEPSDSPARQAFTLRYQHPSDFHADHLHLFTHLQRDAVQFTAQLKQPLAFREAMATLYAVVSSDYRYVPKDRSAYAAFSQMRRSHQNQGLAQAHQAYFAWLAQHDPLAWLVLDPVINVAPDGLHLEVFSKDEGCYALLSLAPTLFSPLGETRYGVTNIDFSPELAQALEQIRSGHTTRFSVGPEAVAFKTGAGAESEVIEKQVQVPHSWLRGFLQVQASAQLTAESCRLKPIDLYNCLHHLRMRADVKGKRRGLRVELLPRQPPRLVLEPDDTVITTQAESYQGKQAKVIRLWGRRRLALLKRFLPYAETVEVRLLGNGMPSFWILRGDGICLTLGITGFTASNWSQALNFDLLLPRRADDLATLTTVTTHLCRVAVANLADLAQATGLEAPTCRTALQQACQQGLVSYDTAQAVYRYRPLTAEPLDMAQFQFRHPAERLAYDLVARQKAIGALNVNLIPHEGAEITATISVQEAKRDYLARLKLNEEGQVTKAECSCPAILSHGLSQGPCSHLIALRLAYAAQLAQRDSQTVTQETRAFMRRKKTRSLSVQLTLHHKHLLIQRDSGNHPQQQFVFNSVQEARQAYLNHINRLEQSGFIEG